MSFYRRNLPHWQLAQAEYFVTFRLAGSLPKEAIERLKQEQKIIENSDLHATIKQRRIFARYEDLLDNSLGGANWLKNKAAAIVIRDAMHYRDQNEYDLYAYCIMPNHVHMVFKLPDQKDHEDFPVTKILQKLKRYTAVECNKLLGKKGQFWQHESFDRVIRNNNELEHTIRYVLNNPVKAGLTDQWENWPYSYCKAKFIDTFR